MGKSSRFRRAQIKAYSRQLGYKEDEFGELRPVMSKAEARERWLNRYLERVKAKIQAEEDEAFFASIDRCLGVGGPHGQESTPAP